MSRFERARRRGRSTQRDTREESRSSRDSRARSRHNDESHRRDEPPHLRRRPRTTFFRLYFGNLSGKTQSKDISSLCEEYGKIDDVNHRGHFCFVQFRSSRAAREALNELDGYRIHGSVISVQPAKTDGRSDGGGDRRRRQREMRDYSRSRSRERRNSSTNYSRNDREYRDNSYHCSVKVERRDVRDSRADYARVRGESWNRLRPLTPPIDANGSDQTYTRRTRSDGDSSNTSGDSNGSFRRRSPVRAPKLVPLPPPPEPVTVGSDPCLLLSSVVSSKVNSQ